MEKAFTKFKAWCESITGDYAPWWSIPVGIAVLVVIVF